MTDVVTSDEELQRIIGKSGVSYRCRCGKTSGYVPDKRLVDVPGWNIRFEPIRRLERTGKTTRSDRVVSTTVTIYECPKCNTRSKP